MSTARHDQKVVEKTLSPFFMGQSKYHNITLKDKSR